MKVLSQDEFRKKFGENGINAFAQTAQPPQPGYFSRVKSAISGNAKEAVQSQKMSASGQMNPFSAGANIAKNVSGAIMAPLAQAPVFKQVGEGFSKAGQAIVDTKLGNKVTDKLASTFSPQTLGTIADTAETGLNVTGIYGTGKSISGGFAKAKSLANDLKTPAGPDGVSAVPEDIRLQSAIKDATPDYESSSPTEKGKMLGRAEEGGFLKGRTVKPTDLEVEAGTELSKLAEYDPNATKMAKYQIAQKENVARAKQLEADLGQEKVVVPKREVVGLVRRVANTVPKDSLLLMKSDPVIKNYMRVVQNAVNSVEGNLGGVLKLRKLLDATYENAKGKQAFGSDKLSALDEIHKPVRDALTQYLIDNAKNTQVQQSLRSQWNLYRAMDMLKTAAEKESGSTVGRAMKKYPMTTKVIKSVGNATGIGGAMNVIGGQ